MSIIKPAVKTFSENSFGVNICLCLAELFIKYFIIRWDFFVHDLNKVGFVSSLCLIPTLKADTPLSVWKVKLDAQC